MSPSSIKLTSNEKWNRVVSKHFFVDISTSFHLTNKFIRISHVLKRILAENIHQGIKTDFKRNYFSLPSKQQVSFWAEFQRVESHNLKFKTWIMFFQPVLINVSKVAPAAKASLLSTRTCKVKVGYSLTSPAITMMMKPCELVRLLIEKNFFSY